MWGVNLHPKRLTSEAGCLQLKGSEDTAAAILDSGQIETQRKQVSEFPSAVRPARPSISRSA